ncbi:UNKNOWN [Stylonychia lemnae]|uniref:BRCT domain-containing protein n=1 Tax=Stylonychia lemnae TaxID=5949 RepID=A0A077ZZ29_STYLE|nr:UNKNOWN [Stylonychia lemnae]|eukprot:CDW73788.1 UNKNOWN [Stylonychia lemnae]
MLGSPQYQQRSRQYRGPDVEHRSQDRAGYQEGNRRGGRSEQRKQDMDQEEIFRGLRVALVTSESQTQNLKQLIGEQGVNQDNFERALRSLDYLIVKDSKLDNQTINKIAQQIGVPREEFQNLVQDSQMDGQGFSIVTPNWVYDCLDNNSLLDDNKYQIQLSSDQDMKGKYKGQGGKKQQTHDSDEDQVNEDTAYTQRHRSRFQGQQQQQKDTGSRGYRKGQHIGHSRYTEGIDYDKISEKDLDSQDERDQYILTQLKKSQSSRRVGTSSPYRNKDGSIDRRRVRDDRGGDYQDEDNSRGHQQRGTSNRGRQADDRNTYLNIKPGEATFNQEDIDNLNPEDFPAEYRNKDGSLDRRKFRSSKSKGGTSSAQKILSQIYGGSGRARGRQDQYQSQRGQKGGEQSYRSGQQRRLRNQSEDENDRRLFGPFNVDRAPTGQFISKGSIKNPIERYPRDSKQKLREQGKGQGETGTRGQQRRQRHSEEEESEIDDREYQQRGRSTSQRYRGGGKKSGRSTGTKREIHYNKDGSIDLRSFGPFNVDRAPTGQLVPKGTLKNPIDKYPDSKTKFRKEGIEEEEFEQRRSRKQQNRNEDDEDVDYDRNRQQQKRSQQNSYNQKQGRNRRQEGDENEHEREKEEEFEQDHDKRHLGPFNVDRAPTGQFVSKGAIKNPINQYPDSKEKNAEPGKSQNRRQNRASQRNQEESESDQQEDTVQQQRRQKQKRSYQSLERQDQDRARQSRQTQESDKDQEEGDSDYEGTQDQTQPRKQNQQQNQSKSRVPKYLQTSDRQTQKGAGKSSAQKMYPLNDAILHQLELIRNHYSEVNDTGRKVAYNKVIGQIRNLNKPINELDDLDQIEGIGQNIRDHIREFMENGRVEGFEEMDKKRQGQSSKDEQEDNQQIMIKKIQEIAEQKMKDTIRNGLRVQVNQDEKNQQADEMYLEIMKKDGKAFDQQLVQQLITTLQQERLITDKKQASSDSIKQLKDDQFMWEGSINLDDKDIKTHLKFRKEEDDF